MTQPPRLRSAPLLDLGCLTTFVLVGAGSHRITDGVGWFVEVMWPLCLGFFAVAALTRLYRRDRGRWLALAVTLVAGLAVTQVLRGAFTHDPWIGVFTGVAATYLGLTMFGWRTIAALVAKHHQVPTG